MRHDETSTAARHTVDGAVDEGRDLALRASTTAFLRAERSDDVSQSDAALRGLFQALPSPLPSREFSSRVLASVSRAAVFQAAVSSAKRPLGAVRPAVRRVRDLAPRHRWLVAAAALCAALVSAYLLPLALLVAGQVEWGALLAGVGAFFGHVVAWLYGLVPFCRAAVSLAHAFWLFVSSPQVLLTLVIATSVVGVCVRLLTELIHSSQDPAHASL